MADLTQERTQTNWLGWWSVFVLFLAYTLSFIDRTIISLLVDPLREDLGLSDFQISLLQGIAFTLFYSTMALPIAYLSDRRGRPLIIGIGMFVWSAMTAACGFAVNFIQLFLARMGVGIGEATLGPAAFSLIADLFPPERRGRAMAVFACGISVGGGMAFLLGGYVIQLVASGAITVAYLEDMASWQLVFIIVGAPGMLMAFLLITVPEPRRKKLQTASPEAKPAANEPVFPFVKQQAVRVSSLFISFGMIGLLSIALLSWGPALLARQYGVSYAEIGKTIGFGLLLTGPAGAFLGGWLCDRGIAQGKYATPYWVGIVSLIIKASLTIAAVFAPNFQISAACIIAALFLGNLANPAGATALQALAPAPLRARVAALYLFAVNLVAATVGPTIVAVFTDFVFQDPAKIGWSVAATVLMTAPIGIVMGIVAARRALPPEA